MLKSDPSRPDLGPHNVGPKSIDPMCADDNWRNKIWYEAPREDPEAIQDAVATANLLAAPLRQQQSITADHLRAVQRRRELPTRLTQGMQVMVQKRLIARALGSEGTLSLPLQIRLLRRWPVLARIPAHLSGIGSARSM